MGKLKIIDKENFLLEGEFEKFIIPANSVIDDNSVEKTIEIFKTEKVDKGIAMGYLNDGFLLIPTPDGQQVNQDKGEPAFMITDIWYNKDNHSIWGQIVVLDTSDGIKIKNSLLQGIETYISSCEIDMFPSNDKNSPTIKMIVGEIKDIQISLMNFHGASF